MLKKIPSKKIVKKLRRHRCDCGKKAVAMFCGRYVCRRCFYIDKELNKKIERRLKEK